MDQTCSRHEYELQACGPEPYPEQIMEISDSARPDLARLT